MPRSAYQRTVIIATVVLVVLAGLVWLGWRHFDARSSGPDWGDVSFGTASSSLAGLGEWQTYTNSAHGFSFKYPPGFTVGEFADGRGETVVVQNAGKRQGFQVYITPAGEDVQITKEEIQSDVAHWKVRDSQPVLLGANDTDGKGLAFKSDNPTFGKSREVWFTYGGYLYQVSTYESLDTLLQQVMNTWVFK